MQRRKLEYLRHHEEYKVSIVETSDVGEIDG